MKRFIVIILSAAILLLTLTSVAYAATQDLQPAATASVTQLPDSRVPMSPLMEEYSWLFWPGLIAAGVVVVLVINIIRDRIKIKKNR